MSLGPDENPRRGTDFEPARKFLETFGRLTEAAEMEAVIRGIAASRKAMWPWIDKWFAEEGPSWVNDRDTLCFALPLDRIAGAEALSFTQEVWRLKPSVFEYQVWAGCAFVRMGWDREALGGKGRQAL